MPFVALTIIWPLKYGFICLRVSLTYSLGITFMIISEPSMAFFNEESAMRLFGIFIPGRYCLFSFNDPMLFASSSLLAHSLTPWPFSANKIANVVPQLPAPMTAIFIFVVGLIFMFLFISFDY